MGVIKRQGIKQSIVNFVFVGIAALSMLFVYPSETEAYGLARFIIDTGYLFTPFIALGVTGVVIRFFPEFDNRDRKHHGLLGIAILVTTLGALVFLALAFLFRQPIFDFYEDKSPLFEAFLPYVIPITISTAFFGVFYNYCINHHRIVVPSIFQNLIKLSLPLLILGITYWGLEYHEMALGIVANQVLIVIGIIAYIIFLGVWFVKPDFTFLQPTRQKRMLNYAFFGVLSSMGGVLAVRIDTFMIPMLTDFQSNGIYAIAAFIGNAIAIPATAITQISSPTITKSLKTGDLQNVSKLYKKTSVNLTLVGLLLFVCIITSVEDLFSIMPKSDDLKSGFTVVLIIGLAKIIDMTTSVNNQIINYSKHYRFGMYAILFMAIFNIMANLIFIPRFQIAGAALATLVSITLYNLIKLIFIYLKFKIHPFQKQTLSLFLLAGLLSLVGFYLPLGFHPIVDIAIRSIVIIGFYMSFVLFFKISPDINDLVNQFLKKLKHFNTK